ncbi:hypothetical protein A2U01_0024241, partial [Trifolium medium]|nr:hypothetical protein [Trifolium medium]
GGNGTSSKQFTMVPNPLPPCSYVQNMDYQLPSYKKLGEYPQNPLPPPKEAQYQRTGSVAPYRNSYLRHASSLLHNDDNNNLNDKLPHDVKDTLDTAINEKGIDWDLWSYFDSLDNDDNNNLHDKIPHNNDKVRINFPNLSSLDNDDNNNLHDKIPHDIKDTLDAVVYGKSFHPK